MRDERFIRFRENRETMIAREDTRVVRQDGNSFPTQAVLATDRKDDEGPASATSLRPLYFQDARRISGGADSTSGERKTERRLV
jgi:hypothetical protein